MLVGELIVDPYVMFGTSAPSARSLFVYEHFKETRWVGAPEEWIRPRMQESTLSDRSGSDPDPVRGLLWRFARISMRQYAIRSGKDNNDPAARRILDSPAWPRLREILQRHGRLETPDRLSAAGSKSDWFHLVAGVEFLNPASALRDSTKVILNELGVGTE